VLKRTNTATRSTQSSTRSLPFKELKDIKHNVSMVVYGRSGSGKTTFAATMPKPLLYIDVKDKGTDSIADVKGIKVMQIESFSDFEDTYWYLKNNPKAFKSVVIDTATQLQTMVVREVSSSAKKRAGDWGSMTKQQWGDVAALMKEWLSNYRDLTNLGMDVLFIAQDRTFNLSDEEEANDQMLAPEVGPALSPSVVKTLNADVSVIGNMFIRERKIEKEDKKTGRKVKERRMEYCLGIGPSSIYVRKVRKPRAQVLPDVLVDPEFQDIVDIIRGA